jgi:hypothetical protein
VVLVAKELEPVVDELCHTLDLAVCHRDAGVEGFGVHNALMAVGDCFVEVISPVREETAAGRHLQRRGGDGGYMVMLQVGDLKTHRHRMDELGVRIVWEGQGPGIQGMHLHPADLGGAILSLDVADPLESWGWAGLDWGASVGRTVVSDVAGVELQAEDPAALARRWSLVLRRPVEQGAERGEPVLNFDRGAVRFVPAADGRGEGLGGVDLVATDPTRAGQELLIGGLRIRLV